jgi:elongation factor P--(R)-beta-lysine ligase
MALDRYEVFEMLSDTTGGQALDLQRAHALRRPRLIIRNRIQAALRNWFAGEGFTEVETGQLQLSPGNEAHLSAFATDFIGLDGHRHPLYLHTSPEFAAKKLIAAGETALFTLARCFRNREASPLHAPEFTMLEWYRTHAPIEALMEDCAALLRLAAHVSGSAMLSHRGRQCDTSLAPERTSVSDALAAHAGIDLLATISPDGQTTDRDALAAQAVAKGIRVTADDTWSDVFSKLLTQKVEPHLGLGRAVVLMDYPAPEAALARRKSCDPRLSERFELYACGVELANGFGELTDPVEQRRRFMLEMDEKERIYGERYPLDEELLSALPLMPPTSGIALGFDRLVMLATGAAHIADVLWTAPAGAGMEAP